MQYVYVAQLDGDKVVAVSMLKKSGFEKAPNQVVVPSFDESLLGQLYDAESGTFKEG